MKTLLSILLSGTVAFAAPALAQTGNSTTTNPPAASSGANPSAPVTAESMREMMRQMMQEMMPERDQRTERRGRDREGWEHRRGGDRMERRAMRRAMRQARRQEARRGPMHEAGMRVMFAIMDADGNGKLSLQEAQDFQRRIFSAVDADRDGEVGMEEISGFIHPSKMAGHDDDAGPETGMDDSDARTDSEQPQNEIELELAPDQQQ